MFGMHGDSEYLKIRKDAFLAEVYSHLPAVRHGDLGVGVAKVEILNVWDVGVVGSHCFQHGFSLCCSIVLFFFESVLLVEVPCFRAADKYASDLLQYLPLAECSQDPKDVVGERDFFGRLKHQNDVRKLLKRRNRHAVAEHLVDRLDASSPEQAFGTLRAVPMPPLVWPIGAARL